MLRLECTCGKFLKVNETLLGKKIKCPACGSIQLVKQQAAVTAPSAKSDPHVAPAAKQKPAGNGAAKAAAPAKRSSPKKQPAKKSGNMMLLIVGGAAAALVLLVGVAVGGYFMFIHKSTPEPVTKKGDLPKVEPAPKAEAVGITLFVPHKKGDKREIDVSADLKMDMKVDNASELPPDLVAAMPDKKMHNRIRIQGILQTLDVSDKDEETKIEFTIKKYELTELADKQGASPVPVDTVAIGTLIDGKFKWTGLNGSLPDGVENSLSSVLLSRYMKEAESDIDKLFGTTEKHPAGGTWPINRAELMKTVKSQRLSGAPPSGKELKGEVKGNGKLVGIPEEDGQKFLDIDISMDVSQSDADSSFHLKGVVSVRLPQDASTGPVKKVEKTEGKSADKFEMEWGAEKTKHQVAIKIVFNGIITTKTKYLGNFPISPANTSGSPIDTPKKSDKLIAELREAKAEWVPNQSKVKYSVNYKALEGTMPIGRADYTLFMQFDDGEGGMKKIPVDEPQEGTILGKSQTFANSDLTVTLPTKGDRGNCYLVLIEKVPGNLKETEICRLKVNITGTPPSTAPTTPSTPEKLEIQLSKTRVEHAGGGKKDKVSVSFDYKVTAGAIDEAKLYRVYVTFEGDKTPKGAIKVHEVSGKSLRPKDTITVTHDLKEPVIGDAKYTLFVRELPVGGKTAQEKMVSDEAKGIVSGFSPQAVGKVHFQVTVIGPAQKVKANPKAQPTAITVPVSWNLTSGNINKQANYGFVLVTQAKQQIPLGNIVSGGQLQPTGQSAVSVPNFPGNSFEVHIVEIIGNVQTTVSNQARGSVAK